MFDCIDYISCSKTKCGCERKQLCKLVKKLEVAVNYLVCIDRQYAFSLPVRIVYTCSVVLILAPGDSRISKFGYVYNGNCNANVNVLLILNLLKVIKYELIN